MLAGAGSMIRDARVVLIAGFGRLLEVSAHGCQYGFRGSIHIQYAVVGVAANILNAADLLGSACCHRQIVRQ